jgi:translocation and assembly module TamB
MNKLLKISAYSFGSLLGLVLLTLLFTQTSWFKDILRNEIQDIANENLNGTIKIGSIEGSLFSDIEINEISITQDEQQILFIKQAALDYSLWGLLSNSIGIDFIKIDSLFLKLTQVNDSTWNINQLVKDEETAVEENDTSSFDWEIDLDLFQIKNSNIKIQTIDTTSVIPRQINDINLEASASVKPDIKKLNINKFSVSTLQPHLKISEINLSASLLDNKIDLTNLIIETAKNKLSASGQYYTDESGKSEMSLETKPLHFSEFKEFLPQLGIQIKPGLELSGEYQNSEGTINISIADSLQKINLTVKFSDIKAKPKYKTNFQLTNINVSDWINDTSAQSNINGEIVVEGQGIEIKNLNLSSRIKIENSELMNRSLDSLILSTEVYSGNLQSTIKMVSDFGLVDGKFEIDNIVGDRQINFDTKFVNLNTAPVLLDDNIPSKINLTTAGNIYGISPESMKGSLSISAGNSSFMDYPIDTLNSAILIRSGDYSINKFEFISPAADVNIYGILSQLNESDLSFNLDLKDLSTVPQLRGYQSIGANGKIEGNLKGKIDSLLIGANFNLAKIRFEENSIESLTGELRADINEAGISAEINSSIERINSAATSIKKITFDAEYYEDKINSTVNVTLNDTADLLVDSKVNLDSAITITLSRLELNLLDQAWKNKNDSLKIIIAGNKYTVSNFELRNNEQKIMIDGNFDPAESALKIDIANLKAGELLNIFMKDFNVSATIDTKLKLEGSLDSPKSNGNIKISDLQYDEKYLGDLSADFNLAEDKFNWEFSLRNSEANILSSGYLPMIINADSGESMIPGNEPLSFDLKIDSLTLTKLSEFNDNIEKVQGVISSDIKFSNSLDDLVADGYFKINNAAIESKILGVRYENVNLNFEAEKEKFHLREFVINSDEGSINIDGYASYKNGLLDGEFDELEINLIANEFTVAETENYEAKIDGKINFTNRSGEAKFNGEIELMRSRVFLPYFTDAASEKQFDESKPILIRELGRKDSNRVSGSFGKTDSVESSASEYEFIKNISGQFTLVIPKNTWIVSPKLNIELSGEIDVVKTGSRLELFGNVDVVRGKVEVYGKEFDVIEGKIFFSGGDKINPELALTLEYMFRGADRSKQYLQVIVEGTPENPKLTFLLNDTQIDEGNAISYLLFGKSLDQLTQSQRTNVNNSNVDLAKTIAGNFLAAQLSSTVGSALGLDVIEIEGNNSWNSATLTAGKYLTDELYVSYERGFGSTETNETNPRIVTLEYGLTKFLYFQLVEGNDKNSGFDVILKFDW